MKTWVRRGILACALAVLGGLTSADAQGPFTAQIQAFYQFLMTAPQTMSGTWTFTNIIVNGTCTGCSGGSAPINATYLTQTANSTLTNEQALGALSSGILRGATTTGVVTSLGDILPTANGGTGIAFFTAAGPTVARIYTFPDAAATILYSGGALGTPSSGTLTSATGLPLTTGVTGVLPLANGGTAAVLADPNADRVAFWDDSAGAVTWLTMGTNLTITGTTLDAASAGGDVVGPSSSVDNSIVRFDGTTGKLVQGYSSGAPTVSDTGVLSATSPIFAGEPTIVHGTITTALSPLSITETRNASGVTFPGIVYNITDTASATASSLLDLQVGGSSHFSFKKAGPNDGYPLLSTAQSGFEIKAFNAASLSLQLGNSYAGILGVGAPLRLGSASTDSIYFIALANSSGYTAALAIEANNILSLRNSTAAQRWNIYNTFTTVATAGEWWKQDWQGTANQFRMGTVSGSSSGTARVATWDYGSKLADATAAITVPITSGNITFGGGITLPGGAAFLTTNTALTDGAGVGAGTILTAPAAGNPTKWIGINDNGTTRYIPAW